MPEKSTVSQMIAKRMFMKIDNILLTAFLGTSSEVLLRQVTEYEILLLPNDKIRDSEILLEIITKGQFDYAFCFGQKPIIKDKVSIECTGKDGIGCIETSFDCNELKNAFELNDIEVKVSSNAGTSFCNQLYVNSLRYVSKYDMKTKIVFIHIPFLKNISDTSFFRKIIDSIETFSLQ